MKESIIYFVVKLFGAVIRLLPLRLALLIGKASGIIAYYIDLKHRTQAYANLKVAFAQEKSFHEIKGITKALFMNFGQNIVELVRMPLLNKNNFMNNMEMVGQENIDESLKQGKGVILLAMHFGSWELASVTCAMLGYDYKVFVKDQEKYSKLNELLNSYRTCAGSIVLNRGIGTRDLIKGLKNNEAIGMVVDQGGRDGILVPFFNKHAKLSVGAIRLAQKLGAPVCFSIIIRLANGRHRMVVEKPIALINTGNTERDLQRNLKEIAKKLEEYIRLYPHQYMWFYKIWKYSDQADIAIISDGKIGHQRQSESIAVQLKQALKQRDISANIKTVTLIFKDKYLAKIFSLIAFLSNPYFFQGRLGLLRRFLTEDSFNAFMSVKADFIVSCGSSIACINHMLSVDLGAKSIVNLTPGITNKKKFDLVILPQHDREENSKELANVVYTKGAPNLISDKYLDEQKEGLLKHFSHLKSKVRDKIGIFIGGSSNNVYITQHQIRVLLRQIREVSNELNMDIMITTSRRTPPTIERYLKTEVKADGKCILCVIANDQNVPEAVGGILALSDIVVVSGDSISMISEAVTSGKQTIVFLPKYIEILFKSSNKHKKFIKTLDKQGYVFSTNVQSIGRTIYDIAKSKIRTRRLDDNSRILEAVKKII